MGGLTEGSIFSGFPAIASPLAMFMIQLIVILSFTRLLVFVLSPLKQPAVISEVIAGILLGPSALSSIPAFKDTVFPNDSLPKLQLFANVALVLFMYVVGIELDFRVLTANLRKSIAISITGIAIPFGLGTLVALLLNKTYPPDDDSAGGFTSFVLFGGTAMSITAFPVLARILSEQGLLSTRLGATVMNAAAVDDVIAWTVLALVIAISRATSPLSAVWTLLSTAAFLIVMFFAVGPLLNRIAVAMTRRDKQSMNAGHDQVPISFFVLVILVCLAAAYTTELLGVHAIFGAFIAGIIMPRHRNMHLALGHKIEDLVVAIFLPLYFTYSGLRTKFNALDDGKAWGMVVLVITAAVVGKFGGCSIVARMSGMKWRDSAIIGTFMNAKGLVELIVLNVGLDLGVLTPLVFAIFVFMALVTTFMTVPLVHLIYPPHKIIEDDRAVTEAAVKGTLGTGLEQVKVDKGEQGNTAGGEGTGHQQAGSPSSPGVSSSDGSHGSNQAGKHASGVHSIFMATFGPHFSGGLVSVAAALLPSDHSSSAARAELCHFLPVDDRPSSYLHSMTGQASIVRVPAAVFFVDTPPPASVNSMGSSKPHSQSNAGISPAAQNPSLSQSETNVAALAHAPTAATDPAAMAQVEGDMALLLGMERARHLDLVPKLTLSQASAADAASAILLGASSVPKPADLILVGYDASSLIASHNQQTSVHAFGVSTSAGAGGAAAQAPSTPTGSRNTRSRSIVGGFNDDTPRDGSATGRMGGFLDALVDKFVPTRQGEAIIRSLVASAPASARLGILVSPSSTSTISSSTKITRALMVVVNLQVDQGLLQTVGSSLASNGASLEVLLVTDIPSAGVERGSRATTQDPGNATPIASTARASTDASTATADLHARSQRTLDETQRLLGQKAAIGRAIAGPGASVQRIQDTAAGVHVAHHTAIDVAIRTLNADARGMHGRGFDLVVVSGASNFHSEATRVATAATDAAHVGIVVDAEADTPVSSSKTNIHVASSSDSGFHDDSGSSDAAAGAPIPAPLSFPEIASSAQESNAEEIGRRQSGRTARPSSLASMFQRENTELAAAASPSPNFLGPTATRILFSGINCNMLVCVTGMASSQPAST